MKNCIQIALVTAVQFIACYLAAWGIAETGFILFFVLLWQGLFIWLFIQISKKKNAPHAYQFSKVIWCVIMPISSLFSPLLCLMVFIGGTLCDLRKISGSVSIKEWVSSQLEEQPGESLCLDFEPVEFARTNPATGLMMSGCVDAAGNPYGSNNHNRN